MFTVSWSVDCEISDEYGNAVACTGSDSRTFSTEDAARTFIADNPDMEYVSLHQANVDAPGATKLAI